MNKFNFQIFGAILSLFERLFVIFAAAIIFLKIIELDTEIEKKLFIIFLAGVIFGITLKNKAIKPYLLSDRNWMQLPRIYLKFDQANIKVREISKLERHFVLFIFPVIFLFLLVNITDQVTSSLGGYSFTLMIKAFIMIFLYRIFSNLVKRMIYPEDFRSG